MNSRDCLKVELQADVVPAHIESDIVPTLVESEIPADSEDISNAADIEADPLDHQSSSEGRKKSLKTGLLKTNAEKFEYAQKIVNEVVRRVPIFSQSEEEKKTIADKLRIRMMRIKNRILNDIKLPLEEVTVAREKAKIKRNSKYKRMIEKETPEEAALRRKKEAEAKSYHRHIQKELETPELLLERRNEKLKKRLERKATETPEERLARREQTRNYRLMLKTRQMAKTPESKPKEMVCAKTGIVYDKNTKKPKNRKNKNSKESAKAPNISETYISQLMQLQNTTQESNISLS